MKQYFAYGAFAVCLLNAVVRPDVFSASFVLIAGMLVAITMVQTEANFQKEMSESFEEYKKQMYRRYDENKKELNEIKEQLSYTRTRIGELEEYHLVAQKELADTKRVVRDINLANTFVPRAKRGGAEL